MAGNLTINLDPVVLREATTQALMGVLTPEVRDRILEKAISNILNPGSGWDSSRSVLQIAFDDAVKNVARQCAEEYVKSDEGIMARLKDLVRKTADKLFNINADELADKMAEAFVRSIERSRD